MRKVGPLGPILNGLRTEETNRITGGNFLETEPGADFFFSLLQESINVLSKSNSFKSIRKRVAGVVLEVSAANEQVFEALTDSFKHQPYANEPTDFRVYAWSADEERNVFPSPPMDKIHLGHRGEIEKLNGKRFRYVFHSHSQALLAVDCQQGIVIVVVKNRKSLLGIDCAAPLRTPLSWLLVTRGIAIVHAAAISKQDKAILLVGRAGAGKSTLAYRSTQAGWRFLGDDLVALSSSPSPKVLSLYSTVKLWNDHGDSMLPSVLVKKWQEKNGKAVFRLDLLNQNVFAHEAALAAVVLVDRSLEPGRFERASQGLATSIVGASTQLTIPNSDKEIFHILSSNIRSVSCWRFSPQDDQTKSCQRMEEILA